MMVSHVMNEFDEKDEKTLVAQQQALSSYLDALFREVPPLESAPEEVTAPVTAKPPSPVIVPEPVLPVLEPAPAPQKIVLEEALSTPLSEPEAEVQAVIYQPTSAFQALFFQVGKLKLAVPLEKLAGILKNDNIRITAVPGYASWHLGLVRNAGTTINIVDTGQLVVPTHRQEVIQDRRQYRYFILVDEKRWGLSCHALADVVTLEPEEVKWRSNRAAQPWLAGTVIERMCALLDVDGFLKMLHQGPGH